ncbi:MAG: hypothetical protein NTU54_05480 [Candidatus Omnitrophica bacterium]|nr:hypothetical protein [Candidatus Omnitrophota bacterium]
MIKKLSIIILALILSGCAECTKHFIIDRTNATNVSFDVTLDKGFVRSMSSIGGGEAAMLLLVGPFTNNGVLLVGKENIPSGEKMAFRQRLSWGKNNFEVLLNNNTTYQLVALVQGTRTGSKNVGSIQVGAGGSQHCTINLLENEVSVK